MPLGLVLFVLLLAGVALSATTSEPDAATAGEEIYLSACAGCHGPDGTGQPQERLGFELEVPDFTDCSFATREPDADWVGVGHEGGPQRGFSEIMPAFGSSLSADELQLSVDHIRTFCQEPGWPRGELNFPRSMFVEKAYVEDEAVLMVGSTTEGPVSVDAKFVYEQRVGSRSQFEIVIPFGIAEQEETLESGDGGWDGGLGDIAFGIKHALLHSSDAGSIVSLTGEVIFPTGNVDAGLGKGTAVFEPFLGYGQDLGIVGFLQFQGGVELPFNSDIGEQEGFWRLVYGRTFVQGAFGRAWSPMVSVLGSMELEAEAPTHWDLVPQLQVTLNQRQHVMANVAVRIPVEPDNDRSVGVFAYLLWDWFDGGFTEGW